MEEVIQIALQEEYSHRQARTPTSVWQGHNASSGAVQGAPAAGASTGPVPMELGRGQVSVRLANGTVVNVSGVRMDLAVKFEDFDSTESFLVLDMDKYDLILGMLWLEKHEPWIDWRGQAIGAIRPAVSDRALVSNVPTSVRDWGARNGHQGAYDSKKSSELLTPNSNAESRRAVWASSVEVPDGTDQAVPHEVEETEKKNESAACVSSVVPHSESETPPARPVEEQCHVFDGVSDRQVRAGAVHLEVSPEVSVLLNLEELSMKDFLAQLKAGEIAEMVLLKPDTSPEDLNFSSVMDEDVLEGFTKQRATRLGSEILKNPTRGIQCILLTTIPHKDVLLKNTSGCTLYNPPGLVDGYYQILMRESDIPLTAVSTPSGTLWEWLVMPQGLSNAPATRAEGGQTAMEVHLKRLRRVFEVMRAIKLYDNID
ncbi:Putative Polyprotein, partial [Phytophthora palmivora]